MDEDKKCWGDKEDVKYMVEDITVTPFFKSHQAHMAATIKLHAQLKMVGEEVVLETDIPGYCEQDVQVEATANSIDVTLVVERKDGEEIKFHNSYFTPQPIDEETLKVKHGGGKLKVSAHAR